MTTFKEKAEQYVREQLPELGTVPKKESALKRLAPFLLPTIELQHWLRVLAEESSLADSMGLIDADFGINGHLIFQFRGEDVRFNLTTGQPATEADYQAFCTIVQQYGYNTD